MLKGVVPAGVLLAGLVWAAAVGRPSVPDYIFTAAAKYDARAWTQGRERFPAGAALMLATATGRRKVAPDFLASADGAVFFDSTRILFSGKRTASDHWQIWEIPVAGGAAKAIVQGDADFVKPLYLPDGRFVCTRMSAQGSEIVIVPAGGGKLEPLTFVPGWYLTNDVLRDGRILFEFGGELFTVYPDGTGVESIRCDHGPKRADGRQNGSGDVIFSVGTRLAKFVSARAEQVDVAQPGFDVAGPVAEVSAGSWIVAMRRKSSGAFGLFLWTQATQQIAELEPPAAGYAVEPAIVRPRTPPRDFPSALVPARKTGNLLCLNARASKMPIASEVRTVRVYTQGAAGAALLLGEAPVERDGSFYIEVPPDRPLRIETVDATGGVVRAERGWFWMRPSEQRVCVGCHTGPERSPENAVPQVLLRTTVPEKVLGQK